MILVTYEHGCFLLLFPGMRSKKQVPFGKINIRTTNPEIPRLFWSLIVNKIVTRARHWFVSWAI